MAGVQLNPLTQRDTQAPNVTTQVVEQPRDTFVSPATSDATRLGSALQDFMPLASPLINKLDHNNQVDATNIGLATQTVDPYSAMANIDSMKQPDSVAPAYAKFFQEGYRTSIGQSIAGQSRDDFLQAYAAQKNNAGFDPNAFVEEWKQKEFSGISDPTILGALHKEFIDTEASMRTDYRAKITSDLLESSKQSFQQVVSKSLSPDLNAFQLNDKIINDILPSVTAQGVISKPEAISAVADQIFNMSSRAGGRPELFDTFDIPDANGLRLIDTDPKLANKIQDYRQKAVLQQEKTLNSSMAIQNSLDFAKINDFVKNGQFSEVTDEKLQQYLGSHGIFAGTTAYEAFREKRDLAMAGQADIATTLKLAQTGDGALATEANQKKALTAISKPIFDVWSQAILTNDPHLGVITSQAVNQLIHFSGAGYTVSNELLDNVFNSLSTAIPAADGQVPPKFATMAQAYRLVKESGNPTMLKGLSEDTKMLLDNYNKATNGGGSDAWTAYTQSYKGITPEAKKFAKDELESDEGKGKLLKTLQAVSTWSILDSVQGIVSKFTPLSAPDGHIANAPYFNTSVTNMGDIKAAASIEADRFLRTTSGSGMGADDLKKHLDEFIKTNHVYDDVSKTLVRVPAGDNSESTQKAISAVTQYYTNIYGNNAGISLVNVGGSNYQVRSKVGGTVLGGFIKLDNIKAGYLHATQLTGDEGSILAGLQAKMASGTFNAQDASDNGGLLAKAKQYGMLDQKQQSFMWGARTQAQIIDRAAIEGMPQGARSYPKQEYDRILLSNAAPSATATSISNKFFNQGGVDGLTAALIAHGEGNVSVATQGLAYGEGKNIGNGVNLLANKDTIRANLVKALVPAESVDAVLSGKLSLTEDQSMRLTKTMLPHYQDIARKATSAITTGANSLPVKIDFNKFPPQVQAVLTDVAWQVGNLKDSGNFKPSEAIKQFQLGNFEEGMDNLRVFYKNNKTLVQQFDVGRYNQRVKMLTNPSGFGTVITQAGKKPTNLVEASAQQ